MLLFFAASALGLLGAVRAVMFPLPHLPCDPILPSFQGCFRGQHCSRRGFCEPPVDQPQPPSTTSQPNASDAHASSTATPSTKRAAAPTAMAQDIAGFRPVLPIMANDKVSALRADRNLSDSMVPVSRKPPTIRADGMCGASNGDAICPRNECCSAYGYCGITSSHCGSGCQSGPCKFGKRPDEKAFAPITHKMQGAKFQVVGQSGVPAMHAALMPNNKVVFLDKIEDYTQLTLESGYYAYSSEYDLETNNAVPLAYKTNSFCAGGSFLANGTLMSVGGNADLPWIDPTVGDGFKGVRFLERELDGDALDAQPWREPGQQLDSARWYPTLQTLPNGHIMVVAGSLTGLDPSQPKNNNPTYEMINADGLPYGTSIPMAILVDSQPYYMYPFIHVLKDGNLFIFAARSSELFDVRSGTTVKKFPDLVGDYRIYPNTGSSAVLPLRAENDWSPEVIVCGGGSYVDITSPTENTCGRIRPLDETPDWEVELMPQGRTMVDAQLLPDGTVLWINGCNKGAQGFGIAKDPIFDAWIYDPSRPPRQRWYEAGASEIPRLYHSVALLLLDGTVLITGSNPVEMPVLTPNPSIPALAYVTEFRVEIYTPPYLAGRKGKERPTDLEVSTKQLRPDGMTFKINFVTHGQIRNELKVALYHGGFVTHSLHMSSRMLFLEHHGFEGGSLGKHEVFVKMPTSGNVVPPGPYHLYAVVDGVPSVGQFVMVDMEEKYKHTASRPPEGDEGKPDSGGGAAPEKGKHDTKKGSKKNAKKRKGNRKTTSGNANLSQATPDLEAQRAPVTPHWEFAKAHEMVVAHLVNNDNKSNVTVP